VNSAATAALGLDDGGGGGAADHPGIERDHRSRATGRLHRLDAWLRERLPDDGPPPFAEVGRRLASCGVTGVTDATPSTTVGAFALLADAVASGELPQQVTVTGGTELAGVVPPTPLRSGPVKVVVDDGSYPSVEDLAGRIAFAHAAGRPVAVHCVTRVALALLLAAYDVVGPRSGDRIEHGSVIGDEHLAPLRALGVTVVTQPSFVAERGDRYLAEVGLDDVEHLYRCGSLLDAGIPVAAGSDAPHADPDPWAAIAAATTRATPSGRVLGAGEAVAPEVALGLFLGRAERPGGPPRRVEPGARADLCLLRAPLAEALRAPDRSLVRLTVVGGRACFDAEAPQPG
jgi:predicted amidohydrolase YtcJ